MERKGCTAYFHLRIGPIRLHLHQAEILESCGCGWPQRVSSQLVVYSLGMSSQCNSWCISRDSSLSNFLLSLMTLVPGRRQRLYWRRRRRVYDKKPVDVTSKTTEQHFIVHSGKSEAEVITRGQSNLTKSASRGRHSPVRDHPRGSKFVPLNSWGRGSY